jgi:enoyl-CoA hydratase/carnithine racemase
VLKVDIDGAVARITLDRPRKRNALSPALLRGLIAECVDLGAREEVRVVVLDAAGESFSAGADLMGFIPELQGPDGRDVADLGRRAAEALAGLPQPTLACVRGSCVGGGVVLASACDLVFSSASARFRVPEIELGVPLAWGGTTRLVRAIGPAATADLVMTCRWFDAAEARQLGLVSRVVDDASLEGAVDKAAAGIAAHPRGPLRVTKQQIARALEGRPDDESDADALLAALQDPETLEAAQRYLASLAAD